MSLLSLHAMAYGCRSRFQAGLICTRWRQRRLVQVTTTAKVQSTFSLLEDPGGEGEGMVLWRKISESGMLGGASKSATGAARGRFGEVVTWQVSRDKWRGCEMRQGFEVVDRMYYHLLLQASRTGRYPGPCEGGRRGNFGGQADRSSVRGHPLQRTATAPPTHTSSTFE